MAYKIYKDELKNWQRRQTTINDIDDYIMRTTGAYWSTIERVQGVKERLQRLQEHVAPSNYAREQEILVRYDAVRKSAKATQADEWLRLWKAPCQISKSGNFPRRKGFGQLERFFRLWSQSSLHLPYIRLILLSRQQSYT